MNIQLTPALDQCSLFVLNGAMRKYAPWYDSEAEKSRLLAALSEVRRLTCSAEQTVPLTLRPGSFMLMEAIRNAIDNYAECEMESREYFWSKPHSAGGR